MTQYRQQLPQLGSRIFLTDGGMETTLIFLQGIELPEFSAITLMDNPEGLQIAKDYFQTYLRMAQDFGIGFILESVTWRGSSDWAAPLGYRSTQLEQLNRKAIRMLHDLRTQYEASETPIVISGCIGPRGDAYDASDMLTTNIAQHYHAEQIRIFREENADLVTAMTLTSADEAIGITRAAQAENIPVVISFTLETDGRLPNGQSLADAIEKVDTATGRGPAYFMINCAHPSHFIATLRGSHRSFARIRGIRANASCKSHAELDEATELDSGDPYELGLFYLDLQQLLPQLTVIGGCCGTDHRHIEAMGKALLADSW
jgi:S-methylmethionine-dependent homocysteine/selenocysteine methylase